MNARRRLVVRSANPELRLGLLLAAVCLGLAAETTEALVPNPNPSESTHTSRRPTNAVSFADLQPNQAAGCDVDGFATKTGDALAEHIRSMTYKCMNNLFDDAPQPIRTAAFRTRNMLDMAQATVELMKTYEGVNPDHLFSKHYLFLRIAYNNLYNHPGVVEWEDGTSRTAVDNAVLAAVEAFLQNDHFYDFTDAHGEPAWEVFVLMANHEFKQHSVAFLPKFKGWLRRFGPQHVEKYDVGLSIQPGGGCRQP